MNILYWEIYIILARKARSTLWQEGGTGSRIFGNDIADSAVGTNTSQYTNKTNKNTGKRKGNDHKKRTQRNARQSNEDECELERYQPIAAMQALSI